MAILKRIFDLPKSLTKRMCVHLPHCLRITKQSYFTYVNEPSMIIPDKEPCWLKTAEEAFKSAELRSDQSIFIQGAAATPIELLRALSVFGKCCKIKNVKLYHMHLEGPALFAKPENAKHFKSMSFFIGSNVRAAIKAGTADCIPIFLHEIPRVFSEGHVCPDIALIQVSPPDKHGYCSLGTSVDCVRAAISHSKKIIAMVNKKMPRTFGDAIIHMSHIDFAVEHEACLPAHKVSKPSKEEEQIGKNIAENLVVDGATLQMGIGSIPDAVLSHLHKHKNLGIHSEMFSDGVIDLVKKGCITNYNKSMHQGILVGSFCVGSQKLYDYMHDNPSIVMLKVDYVNDLRVIAKQRKMTAINSCIEVDITGQICSDSIGTQMYSGFGGQLDFITGAAMSKDRCGKPIIALQSVTKKGVSKIQPILKPGAGVVTNRAVARYIVTEHGIASLFGKALQQRAYEIIQIAHPDHRETLEKAAFERLKVMPSPSP